MGLLCPARAVHLGPTPIPSQRARVSSVGKTPSFSFCQVDMYAHGIKVVTLLPSLYDGHDLQPAAVTWFTTSSHF